MRLDTSNEEVIDYYDLDFDPNDPGATAPVDLCHRCWVEVWYDEDILVDHPPYEAAGPGIYKCYECEADLTNEDNNDYQRDDVGEANVCTPHLATYAVARESKQYPKPKWCNMSWDFHCTAPCLSVAHGLEMFPFCPWDGRKADATLDAVEQLLKSQAGALGYLAGYTGLTNANEYSLEPWRSAWQNGYIIGQGDSKDGHWNRVTTRNMDICCPACGDEFDEIIFHNGVPCRAHCITQVGNWYDWNGDKWVYSPRQWRDEGPTCPNCGADIGGEVYEDHPDDPEFDVVTALLTRDVDKIFAAVESKHHDKPTYQPGSVYEKYAADLDAEPEDEGLTREEEALVNEHTRNLFGEDEDEGGPIPCYQACHGDCDNCVENGGDRDPLDNKSYSEDGHALITDEDNTIGVDYILQPGRGCWIRAASGHVIYIHQGVNGEVIVEGFRAGALEGQVACGNPDAMFVLGAG